MISRTTARLCRECMQSLMLACLILSGAVVSRTADASQANEVSARAEEITKEIAEEIRRGIAFPEEKLHMLVLYTRLLVDQEDPHVALRNLDYIIAEVTLARQQRLFPESQLSATLEELVSLRDSLARLTAGDVKILKIETKIQPGDRVIKLVQDGEAHAVVYRIKEIEARRIFQGESSWDEDSEFLGYVPQQVLLHIGDNQIKVITEFTGSHNIHIHSDGLRAIIKNITYDIDNCYNVVPSEKEDYERWANTMRGRELALSSNIPLLKLRKPIPVSDLHANSA